MKSRASGDRDYRTHVMFVALNFSPEFSGSGPYSADIARFLVERGARVTVVAAVPHYPGWRRWAGYRNRWTRESNEGLTIYRVPIFVPRNPTAVGRAVFGMSFVVSALPILLFLRYDRVLGTTPDVMAAWLASIVARIRKVPLIQVVQDLVSVGAAESGLASDGSVTPRLIAVVERAALRHAQAVTIPTDSFCSALSRLGVDSTRVVTVRNWVRHPHSKEVDRKLVRARYGWSDSDFLVLHTGNMGYKQGLEELNEALGVCQERVPSARFVFVGDGSRREALAQEIGRLRNVELRPPVDNESYGALLAAADALLVKERSTLKYMSVPSKLTAYFAAGRPVLAVVASGGATANEIDASGAGLVVGSSSTGLAEAIERLMSGPNLAARFGSAGRSYAEVELNPDVSRKRITDIVLGQGESDV